MRKLQCLIADGPWKVIPSSRSEVSYPFQAQQSAIDRSLFW